MQIALGAMAPKLSDQLKGLVADKDLEVLDADAAAITRLYIRGYIPESQADRSRKKLVKAIDKALDSFTTSQNGTATGDQNG